MQRYRFEAREQFEEGEWTAVPVEDPNGEYVKHDGSAEPESKLNERSAQYVAALGELAVLRAQGLQLAELRQSRDNLRGDRDLAVTRIATLEQQLAEMRDLVEELRNDLINIIVGGCTCGTKPPDPALHELNCHYRMAETGMARIAKCAALAPTAQPSRGKCARCDGSSNVQMAFGTGTYKCPDCAQPERQGADTIRVLCDNGIALAKRRDEMTGGREGAEHHGDYEKLFREIKRALRPSPPQDDIVAGLRGYATTADNSGVIVKRGYIERAIAALATRAPTNAEEAWNLYVHRLEETNNPRAAFMEAVAALTVKS